MFFFVGFCSSLWCYFHDCFQDILFSVWTIFLPDDAQLILLSSFLFSAQVLSHGMDHEVTQRFLCLVLRSFIFEHEELAWCVTICDRIVFLDIHWEEWLYSFILLNTYCHSSWTYASLMGGFFPDLWYVWCMPTPTHSRAHPVWWWWWLWCICHIWNMSFMLAGSWLWIFCASVVYAVLCVNALLFMFHRSDAMFSPMILKLWTKWFSFLFVYFKCILLSSHRLHLTSPYICAYSSSCCS